MGPALAQRGGGLRGLPDSLGSRQHGDRRLQRRAQSRLRGRSAARLVPQTAPQVRDDLPPDQHGCRSPDLHDRRQPGQCPDAGRSVRVRRGLELRVQGPVDAGPPVQAARPPRVRSSPQLPGRQVRRSAGHQPALPCPCRCRAGQRADQGGGHHRRLAVHLHPVHDLLPAASGPITGGWDRASTTSTSSSSTRRFPSSSRPRG